MVSILRTLAVTCWFGIGAIVVTWLCATLFFVSTAAASGLSTGALIGIALKFGLLAGLMVDALRFAGRPAHFQSRPAATTRRSHGKLEVSH